MKFGLALSLAVLTAGLASCSGGTRLIKNAAPPPQVQQPLATAADGSLSADLDWVIVRDGPGTWARNADWDEYLLRLGNTSGAPLTVTSITLFDSMDQGNAALGTRSALVAASRKNARRYKDSGVKVAAGRGSLAMVSAGAGASAAGLGLAYASVWGGASSGTMAAAGGMILAGPALVTLAIVRGVRKGAVSDRIEERATVLPVVLEAGTRQAVDIFFPLSPSPTRLVIGYTDPTGPHVLVVDTAQALAGLHVATLAAK